MRETDAPGRVGDVCLYNVCVRDKNEPNDFRLDVVRLYKKKLYILCVVLEYQRKRYAGNEWNQKKKNPIYTILRPILVVNLGRLQDQPPYAEDDCLRADRYPSRNGTVR